MNSFLRTIFRTSWLIISFLALSDARAEDLRDITRAKSITQVENLLSKPTERSHAQRVCAEQLKGGRIPSSCFKIIQNQSSPEFSWLNQECGKRVRASSDLEELQAVQKTAEISQSCQSAAAERLEDLRYVALKNSSPDAFFLLMNSSKDHHQ